MGGYSAFLQLHLRIIWLKSQGSFRVKKGEERKDGCLGSNLGSAQGGIDRFFGVVCRTEYLFLRRARGCRERDYVTR